MKRDNKSGKTQQLGMVGTTKRRCDDYVPSEKRRMVTGTLRLIFSRLNVRVMVSRSGMEFQKILCAHKSATNSNFAKRTGHHTTEKIILSRDFPERARPESNAQGFKQNDLEENG